MNIRILFKEQSWTPYIHVQWHVIPNTSSTHHTPYSPSSAHTSHQPVTHNKLSVWHLTHPCQQQNKIMYIFLIKTNCYETLLTELSSDISFSMQSPVSSYNHVSYDQTTSQGTNMHSGSPLTIEPQCPTPYPFNKLAVFSAPYARTCQAVQDTNFSILWPLQYLLSSV